MAAICLTFLSLRRDRIGLMLQSMRSQISQIHRDGRVWIDLATEQQQQG